MAKSQVTFNKIEKEKKRLKKREEKQKKKDARRAEAKEKYDDLVVKILQNLHDPEMRKLASEVSKFRINPDVNDKAFGHIRSAKNALRVLSAKPDATFIATRLQWLNDFNRQVRPDATKIILFKARLINILIKTI
mgnify:CR=1 FL=1